MDTVYQDIHNCCGCAMCESICPKNAIKMTMINGFLYPEINHSLCIDCGICAKKCEFNKEKKNEINCLNSYAVKHREEAVIDSSSSGGIFTALSDYILSNNGVIIGADFDKNMNVHHTIATTIPERNRMRGSKYIQSNLSGIYNEIALYLKNETPVLFTGTPCQVAAIKSYFPNEQNLYLIDIICHGVPSPDVWKKYVDYIETKRKKKLVFCSFRDKKTSGWRQYSMKLMFDDDTIETQNNISGAFIELFRYDVCLRPSCTKCPYSSLNRVGDITIGDFWGIENVLPEIDNNKGISAVMVNTKKGETLFSQISDDICKYNVSCENIAKSQPNLLKPSLHSKKAEEFSKDFKNLPFEKVLKKYTRVGLQRRIIDTIKKI